MHRPQTRARCSTKASSGRITVRGHLKLPWSRPVHLHHGFLLPGYPYPTLCLVSHAQARPRLSQVQGAKRAAEAAACVRSSRSSTNASAGVCGTACMLQTVQNIRQCLRLQQWAPWTMRSRAGHTTSVQPSPIRLFALAPGKILAPVKSPAFAGGGAGRSSPGSAPACATARCLHTARLSISCTRVNDPMH